ncbi:hypothetical protein B7494_g8111, partial [Chlorociboria aeruginascens]
REEEEEEEQREDGMGWDGMGWDGMILLAPPLSGPGPGAFPFVRLRCVCEPAPLEGRHEAHRPPPANEAGPSPTGPLNVTAPKHPAPSVQRQNHHPPAGRVSTGLLAARIFSPTAVAVCRAVRTCEDARRILTLVDGAATQRPHLPSPPQRDIVYIDTSIAGMLLPSAIGCDASQTTPQTRFQCALFASPISPPSSSSSSASASSSSHPAINNLYSTCRALQSMLTVPSQLPSPPTTHADAPSSSFKLRLRARKNVDSDSLTPRKKITKRAPAPPRGVNKRRRPIDDEMTRGDTEDPSSDEEPEPENRPSTPKRQRLAPEVLPLGLERSDFHTLHLQTRETEGGRRRKCGGRRCEPGRGSLVDGRR